MHAYACTGTFALRSKYADDIYIYNILFSLYPQVAAIASRPTSGVDGFTCTLCGLAPVVRITYADNYDVYLFFVAFCIYELYISIAAIRS